MISSRHAMERWGVVSGNIGAVKRMFLSRGCFWGERGGNLYIPDVSLLQNDVSQVAR
jgi:hypothetical protein